MHMKRSRRILIFAVSLVFAFAMLPAAGNMAFAEDVVADDPALEAGDDGQAADEGTDGQPEPASGTKAADPANDGAAVAGPEPEPAAQPEQAEPAQDGVEALAASELTPAAQTITSVSLTATNPVCGTFVKCKGATIYWPPNYQPAPPISVDTANVSVYGAWWVEGTGPSTSTVHPRNEDITVDGSKYYKFVLNLHADEGYDFTEDTTVSISTGSVLGTEFYPGDEWNDSAIIVVLEIPATHDTVTESTAVKEPTCTEPGSHKETVTCQACGAVVSEGTVVDDPATGHDWGEWTVAKNPTATEEGQLVRVCKNDSTHTETRPIPALGQSEQKSNTPKTSDETNFALPAALAVTSALTLGGYFLLRRKTEQE